MTRLEFGALLSEALAAIRDGHTRLEYDEVTTKALSSARLLPLRMAHEGGRLVVVGNDSSVDRSIRPGMELVAVNGRAAEAIIGALVPKMPADGLSRPAKRGVWPRLCNELLAVCRTNIDIYGDRDGWIGRTVSASLEGVTNVDRAKVDESGERRTGRQPRAARGLARQRVTVISERRDVGLLRVRAFDGDTFVASLERAFVDCETRRRRARPRPSRQWRRRRYVWRGAGVAFRDDAVSLLRSNQSHHGCAVVSQRGTRARLKIQRLYRLLERARHRRPCRRTPALRPGRGTLPDVTHRPHRGQRARWNRSRPPTGDGVVTRPEIGWSRSGGFQ